MMNINYSNIICTQFYLVEKNVFVLSKPGKTTVLSHFLTENHFLGFAKLWSFVCGGDDTRRLCGTGIPPSRKFPKCEVFNNLWLISERGQQIPWKSISCREASTACVCCEWTEKINPIVRPKWHLLHKTLQLANSRRGEVLGKRKSY